MGDINGGKSHLLLDLPEFYSYIFTEFGVQVGQRFIQQKYFRIHDEGSGHGHTLLLSAGHLVGETFFHAFQLHEGQGLLYSLLDFILRLFLDPKAVGYIVKYIHMGEKRVFLENHGGIPVIGRHFFNIFPIEENFPFIRLIETGNHAEQCGFSAAGRPQEGNEMAFFKVQIHIFNDVILPKVFINVFQL